MPTAPRFIGEGVNIGEMPVPRVQADMSGADSLRAIGDTFATLGKVADRVLERQDARAAYEAAQAKAKAVAEDNAASELFKDWKPQADGRAAQFQSTKRSETAKGYGDYFKSQTQSVDDFVAGKNLPEGVVSAFKKKAARQLYDYKAQADTHFVNENRAFTIEMQTEQLQEHKAMAAKALGRNDTKAFQASMVDALKAEKLLADANGREYSKEFAQQRAQAIYADVAYDAYKLRSEIDKASAVDFYNQNKGKFGKHENDVAKWAEADADTVWVEVMSNVATSRAGRDEFGNLSMDKMVAAVVAHDAFRMGEEERGAQFGLQPYAATGQTTPERMAKLEKEIKLQIDKDNAERKRIGNETIERINQLYMTSRAKIDPKTGKVIEDGGWEKARVWINTDEGRAVLGRALPDERSTIIRKVMNGPDVSDLNDKRTVQAILADPHATPQAKRAVIDGSILSGTDLLAFNKEYDEQLKNAGKPEDDAYKTVYSFFKEPGGRLQFVDETKEERKNEMIAASITAKQVVEDVKRAKVDMTRENLRKYWDLRMARMDKAQGGIFSPDVLSIFAKDFQPDTPPESRDLEYARSVMPGAPPEQQVVLAELNRRERKAIWAQRMEKAGKLADKYHIGPDEIADEIASATTKADIAKVSDYIDYYQRGIPNAPYASRNLRKLLDERAAYLEKPGGAAKP